VTYLRERFGLPMAQACRVALLPRSTGYYRPKPKRDETVIVARMQALVDHHRSWGHPTIHDVLSREGLVVNRKRSWRLYREAGLSLAVRKRKKRASRARLVLPTPERPDHRWAMDFLQDTLWTGRRFRMLAVLDLFTKECLAIEVDTSLSGLRVARALDWLVLTRGTPEAITVDNGPEFAGRDMDRWAYAHHVSLDFIRPGKPIENAYIESFNGKFRHQCLNEHYFSTLEEAKHIIGRWRIHYNEFRPHSSLNGRTPKEFATQWKENNNPNPEKVSLQPVQT